MSIKLNVSKVAIVVGVITLPVLALTAFSGEQAVPVVEPVKEATQQLPLVKVERLKPVKRHAQIELFGRLEPLISADIASQSNRIVKSLSVDVGQYVQKGDVLAVLDSETVLESVDRARTKLEQRRKEMESQREMLDSEYQSEVVYSEAVANFAQAKAELAEAEKSLKDLTITSPISGFIESRLIEEGELAAVGQVLFEVVDISALKAVAHATEKQLPSLTTGEVVNIETISGETVTGSVTFVSKNADQLSNTYRVEVQIPNEDWGVSAGGSVRVKVDAEPGLYVKVSPALFALDEKGVIGIKQVRNNKVAFTPISLADSDEDGAWVSGLGDMPEVIVLGQGFVRDGDSVQVSYVGE
tara:strand:+ start:12651 stop:13721 length:1071 start_codon:yes stop_codon:yes gene_type:complete